MKFTYRNERTARFLSAHYNKPLEKPEWYKIENVSEEQSEILIYDFIGWPFNDAGEFVRAINGISSKELLIRINSPGGDVFDANAIFNAIKSHKAETVTRVESLAASAASYIAVAGKKKQAYKNAMLMIHEPLTGIWGNQYEMREGADLLKQVSDTMVDMYADNCNVGKRDLKAMLKAETWLKAAAAKEKGFIDTIIDAGNPTTAKFDLSMYANAPDEFTSKPDPTERNLEKALRDAGLSRAESKAMLAGRQQAEEIEILKAQIAAQNTLHIMRR